MKAIKIFFVVLVTVLYSCDPTRVEVLPSAPTELDYFANTDEFRLATFAIYAQSHDLYSSDSPEVNQSRGLAQLWKLPGDDITEVNGAFTEVELFDPGLNSTWNRISGVWNPYYRMIQRANVIIEKVATVDYSDYDGASEIDNMGGEALFLRGYAHFHLFLMFGDVEIDNAVSDGSDFTPMQAFYFRSGVGDAGCAEAPESGMLIQTPEGVEEVFLNVNGANMLLGSTAFLQAGVNRDDEDARKSSLNFFTY